MTESGSSDIHEAVSLRTRQQSRGRGKAALTTKFVNSVYEIQIIATTHMHSP